jgi:hypothetical protein
MTGGILKIDLVRSDAETTDYDEVGCVSQNIRRELGFRSDADDMDVSATCGVSSV